MIAPLLVSMVMKKLVIILLLFVVSLYGYPQNLVQNWSFEDTISCTINPNPGGPEGSPPWFTPTGGSTDYFNKFYSSNCGGGGT